MSAERKAEAAKIVCSRAINAADKMTIVERVAQRHASFMSPIPITVFTGYLGAGKTTTILALLKRLPKYLKVVLLKNEFGDVEVDSKLAQQSSLAGVSEILNGCL